MGNSSPHDPITEPGFLETLFHAFPVPVFVKRSDLTYLRVNHAFEQVLGWSQEQIAGSRASDLFGPDATRVMEEAERGALAARESRECEATLAFADGEDHEVWIHVADYPNEEGGLGGLIGYLVDITQRKRREKELRLLANAFEVSQPIMVTDAQGTIRRVNTAFTEVTGYEEEEVVGENPRILKSGYQGRDFYKDLWGKLIENGCWQGEIWNQRKNGEIFPEWETITTVKDSEGNIVNFVATFSDISGLKAAEQACREESEFAHALLTSLPGLAYLFDQDGNFRVWNQQLLDVSGYTKEELQQLHPLDFFAEADKPSVERAIERVLRKGSASVEAEVVTKSGGRIPFALHGRRLRWHGKNHILGVGIDVSERKRLEEELTRQATHDRLTGVFNRTKLESVLDEELERVARYGGDLSVIMLDLDHFKRVNDMHGHGAGDEVLKAVVDRLSSALRATDVLGRWGGEEFLAILPETDINGAYRVAEKMRQIVADTVTVDQVPITVSAGVTQFQLGEPRGAFLERVDQALYQAKAEGRNRAIAN